MKIRTAAISGLVAGTSLLGLAGTASAAPTCQPSTQACEFGQPFVTPTAGVVAVAPAHVNVYVDPAGSSFTVTALEPFPAPVLTPLSYVDGTEYLMMNGQPLYEAAFPTATSQILVTVDGQNVRVFTLDTRTAAGLFWTSSVPAGRHSVAVYESTGTAWHRVAVRVAGH